MSPPTSKNNQSSKISLKDNNQNFVSEYKEMANLMNYYFRNIEPSQAANMNDPWVYNGNVSDITLIDDFYVETEE